MTCGVEDFGARKASRHFTCSTVLRKKYKSAKLCFLLRDLLGEELTLRPHVLDDAVGGSVHCGPLPSTEVQKVVRRATLRPRAGRISPVWVMPVGALSATTSQVSLEGTKWTCCTNIPLTSSRKCWYWTRRPRARGPAITAVVPCATDAGAATLPVRRHSSAGTSKRRRRARLRLVRLQLTRTA